SFSFSREGSVVDVGTGPTDSTRSPANRAMRRAEGRAASVSSPMHSTARRLKQNGKTVSELEPASIAPVAQLRNELESSRMSIRVGVDETSFNTTSAPCDAASRYGLSHSAGYTNRPSVHRNTSPDWDCETP